MPSHFELELKRRWRYSFFLLSSVGSLAMLLATRRLLGTLRPKGFPSSLPIAKVDCVKLTAAAEPCRKLREGEAHRDLGKLLYG